MGPDPKKIAALDLRMEALGIRKEDITVRFVKSSGRGGQKVNKTSSAVFLRHEPTGTIAKCGKHRSQHLNRFVGLRSLVDQLEVLWHGVPDEAEKKMARIRKQKKRRRHKAVQKTISPERSSSGED